MVPLLPVSRDLVLAPTSSDREETGVNYVATFYSASPFWVRDNSATGHICKSELTFHGLLVPSKFTVSTAIGYSGALLMNKATLTVSVMKAQSIPSFSRMWSTWKILMSICCQYEEAFRVVFRC